MKQTITKWQFQDAFRDYGREDQFSHWGLESLYDWFESLEDDCGTEFELDVIAICCEFYEDSWESIADNYQIDTSDCEDEGEAIQEVEEYLIYNTSLVASSGTGDFVYQAF